MERPRINIANVTPREIKVFEQVFDLELRVQNPNDSPLPINGLEFELQINDRRFATGVSNQSVTVNGLESAVIRVEAVTSLWSILQQIALHIITLFLIKLSLLIKTGSFAIITGR
jgi:LEA14-like dessication related protein